MRVINELESLNWNNLESDLPSDEKAPHAPGKKFAKTLARFGGSIIFCVPFGEILGASSVGKGKGEKFFEESCCGVRGVGSK